MRTPIKQTEVPSVSLEQALRVPKAIFEQLAGGPAKPLHVAQALGMQPSTGGFRVVMGAAVAYGLTSGGYNATEVQVTDLARKILKPTKEGIESEAKLQALLQPKVTGQFLAKYDGHAVPRQDIAENVLEEFGVPADRTADVLELILEGARLVGAISEINGKEYVDLHKGMDRQVPSETKTETFVETRSDVLAEQASEESHEKSPELEPKKRFSGSELGKGIFIAHGRDKDSVAQLKAILDGFKVPFKLAVDEPNLGRPIGEKVRETMIQCNSAIIVLTPDEVFHDSSGSEIWRPSENVFHELGACAFLYDKRIVILKHEKVVMPSNVRELGHIPFDNSGIASKAMDILKELIGFDLLKVSTT